MAYFYSYAGFSHIEELENSELALLAGVFYVHRLLSESGRAFEITRFVEFVIVRKVCLRDYSQQLAFSD